MYAPQQTLLDTPSRIWHVTFTSRGASMSYGNAIKAWKEDPVFADVLTEILANVPCDAVFWETPPITKRTLDRVFEMVLIDAPSLSGMTPDSSAFDRYLGAAFSRGEEAAIFMNLRGDATLVCPIHGQPPINVAHLVEFARVAPPNRARSFWKAVGEAAEERVGKTPLWINTSGLGVPWMHVRLDTKPKYYLYSPYREGY